MTQEEARITLIHHMRWVDLHGFMNDDLSEALSMAIEKFDRPLDGNGLVRCGCGHKLILLGNDEIEYWVECEDISNCMLQIGAVCDGSAGLFYTKEAAIKAANKAMGYEEDT
jgi:hypothetical protein